MDEITSLIDDLSTLAQKPSRRYRWINWIVWSIAGLSLVLTVICGALLASHWLTGWPPN